MPDALVRAADQIELVDMSPEALRRRIAHGNVYPAERIDAALGNYFRPGNLGALRELALLWVAGRVEETLSSYLAAHGITEAWETRERVVVGITGAAGGDRLIRRAARMAGRVGGELVGVHVAVGDGLATDAGAELEGQRRLVGELGGTVHETVGQSRAEALVAFAAAEKATQLVLGGVATQPLVRAVARIVPRRGVTAGLGHRHPRHRDRRRPRAARPRRRGAPPAIDRRRNFVAWVLTVVGIPFVTAAMVAMRDDLELSTALLIYLALVVVVSAIGGRLVAAVAADRLLAHRQLVPRARRTTR